MKKENFKAVLLIGVAAALWGAGTPIIRSIAWDGAGVVLVRPSMGALALIVWLVVVHGGLKFTKLRPQLIAALGYGVSALSSPEEVSGLSL